jgi:hypothetical protein
VLRPNRHSDPFSSVALLLSFDIDDVGCPRLTNSSDRAANTMLMRAAVAINYGSPDVVLIQDAE